MHSAYLYFALSKISTRVTGIHVVDCIYIEVGPTVKTKLKKKNLKSEKLTSYDIESSLKAAGKKSGYGDPLD